LRVNARIEVVDGAVNGSDQFPALEAFHLGYLLLLLKLLLPGAIRNRLGLKDRAVYFVVALFQLGHIGLNPLQSDIQLFIAVDQPFVFSAVKFFGG
jgi:hypothetical protein